MASLTPETPVAVRPAIPEVKITDPKTSGDTLRTWLNANRDTASAPEQATARVRLGWADFLIGTPTSLTTARREAEQVLTTQPEHSDANALEGMLHVRLGTPQEAVPYFTQALQAQTPSPDAVLFARTSFKALTKEAEALNTQAQREGGGLTPEQLVRQHAVGLAIKYQEATGRVEEKELRQQRKAAEKIGIIERRKRVDKANAERKAAKDKAKADKQITQVQAKTDAVKAQAELVAARNQLAAEKAKPAGETTPPSEGEPMVTPAQRGLWERLTDRIPLLRKKAPPVPPPYDIDITSPVAEPPPSQPTADDEVSSAGTGETQRDLWDADTEADGFPVVTEAKNIAGEGVVPAPKRGDTSGVYLRTDENGFIEIWDPKSGTSDEAGENPVNAAGTGSATEPSDEETIAVSAPTIVTTRASAIREPDDEPILSEGFFENDGPADASDAVDTTDDRQPSDRRATEGREPVGVEAFAAKHRADLDAEPIEAFSEEDLKLLAEKRAEIHSILPHLDRIQIDEDENPMFIKSDGENLIVVPEGDTEFGTDLLRDDIVPLASENDTRISPSPSRKDRIVTSLALATGLPLDKERYFIAGGKNNENNWVIQIGDYDPSKVEEAVVQKFVFTNEAAYTTFLTLAKNNYEAAYNLMIDALGVNPDDTRTPEERDQDLMTSIKHPRPEYHPVDFTRPENSPLDPSIDLTAFEIVEGELVSEGDFGEEHPIEVSEDNDGKEDTDKAEKLKQAAERLAAATREQGMGYLNGKFPPDLEVDPPGYNQSIGDFEKDGHLSASNNFYYDIIPSNTPREVGERPSWTSAKYGYQQESRQIEVTDPDREDWVQYTYTMPTSGQYEGATLLRGGKGTGGSGSYVSLNVAVPPEISQQIDEQMATDLRFADRYFQALYPGFVGPDEITTPTTEAELEPYRNTIVRLPMSELLIRDLRTDPNPEHGIVVQLTE